MPVESKENRFKQLYQKDDLCVLKVETMSSDK